MVEEKKTDMKWYAIKTVNNREKGVAERIIKEGERELIGKIGKVVIPQEKVMIIKDGKKIQKEVNLLPGYIFLETNSVGEMKYFLRSVKGTSGFLTARNGDVESLTEAEVNKMIGKPDDSKPVSELHFSVGEEVLITDGPFSSMHATIDEISDKKVKLSVSIFGRLTPLVLEIDQIDRKL